MGQVRHVYYIQPNLRGSVEFPFEANIFRIVYRRSRDQRIHNYLQEEFQDFVVNESGANN